MPATSGRTFAVHDPAAIRPSTGPTTATAIAEVPDMNADDVEHAIAAAHHTFTEWTTPGHAHGHGHAHERSRMLRRWYDLIMTHRQDLANIVTAENGKPYKEALGEVQYGASFVEWFAEEAKRMYGDVIPAPVGGRRLLAMRQPVGVCALVCWQLDSGAVMFTVALAPCHRRLTRLGLHRSRRGTFPWP